MKFGYSLLAVVYLSACAFEDPAVFQTAAQAGFEDPAVFQSAAQAGFEDPAVFQPVNQAGFEDPAVFQPVNQAGFEDPAVFQSAAWSPRNLENSDEVDDVEEEDASVALRGTPAASGNQRQLSAAAYNPSYPLTSVKKTTRLIRNQPTFIVKNKGYGVLTNFGENFRVKFEFCLNGPGHGRWQNIIHLTTGENIGTPGSRIPGMWYNGAGNFLYFALSETTHVAQHQEGFKEDKVDFGIWVPVIISRWNGIYEVTVDKKVVHHKHSRYIRQYPKVHVYVSDPWHNAADGFVRKLRIVQKQGNRKAPVTLIQQRPELPKKNQNLTVLKNYGRNFRIKFSFCLNSAGHGTPYANLIHLTTGPNQFALGSRIPGVWYNSHEKFLTFVNSDLPHAQNNWHFNHAFDEYGIWFDLEISSLRKYFSIKLNGHELKHAGGKLAKKYPEVFVYFSDPWYVPMDGALRNLVIDRF